MHGIRIQAAALNRCLNACPTGGFRYETLTGRKMVSMYNRKIAFCLFALLFSLITCRNTFSAQTVKPVAAWFSGYQVLTFNDEIIWPLELYGCATYAGPVYWNTGNAEFDRYSAVVIGSGGSNMLTREQVKDLIRWVYGGGILILSADEGSRLFDGNVPMWVAKNASWWSGDLTGKVTIQSAHPLVDGISPESALTLECTSGIRTAEAKTSVLGAGDVSILNLQEAGKGKVICMGAGLLPTRNPTWVEKQIRHDMKPAAVLVWKNLIRYLGLPTRSDAIAEWTARTGKTLAIWQRYELEKPIGGALYVPPYPRENEELKEIRFEMGMGERAWKYFFLTLANPASTFEVRPSDLVAADGKTRISASDVFVYIQEKPYPDYDKAPYWLVEQKYVAPVGKPIVSLAGRRTYTYWVKVRVPESQTPGLYRGTLAFRNGNRLINQLPITVNVWPLHEPDPDVLHYELEHMLFAMPGGYWISKDPVYSNPQLLQQYMKHLHELGVDFLQSWGDVDKMYCGVFLKTRNDGKLLRDIMSADPDFSRKENFPRLDFSGYDDIYFDSAIEIGFTNFAMNFGMSAEDLNATERHAFLKWYWGEYLRYLKERGFPQAYTKIDDEMGPESVDNWIKQAALIRAAGFKTYTSTPNFMYEAESVKKIDPYLDMWQWWAITDWDRIRKERNIPWDSNNELWAYTASSFWGNYMDYAQGAGWTIAYGRFKGLHTHGYMRWFWNDHEGCLPGPDGPFDSVTVINNSQSVYQARYLALLLARIDEAKWMKVAPEKVAAVESKIEGIIGPSEKALIPLEYTRDYVTEKYGPDAESFYPRSGLPPERYEAAKVAIFHLLLEMKGILSDAKPGVRYGNLNLIKDGRVRVHTIVHDENILRILSDRVKALCGITLPSDASNGTGRPILLVAGTLSDTQELKQLAEKEFPGDITPLYPRPGHYAIKCKVQSDGGIILIVGGDESGLEKGMRAFTTFLIPENRW